MNIFAFKLRTLHVQPLMLRGKRAEPAKPSGVRVKVHAAAGTILLNKSTKHIVKQDTRNYFFHSAPPNCIYNCALAARC